MGNHVWYVFLALRFSNIWKCSCSKTAKTGLQSCQGTDNRWEIPNNVDVERPQVWRTIKFHKGLFLAERFELDGMGHFHTFSRSWVAVLEERHLVAALQFAEEEEEEIDVAGFETFKADTRQISDGPGAKHRFQRKFSAHYLIYLLTLFHFHRFNVFQVNPPRLLRRAALWPILRISTSWEPVFNHAWTRQVKKMMQVPTGVSPGLENDSLHTSTSKSLSMSSRVSPVPWWKKEKKWKEHIIWWHHVSSVALELISKTEIRRDVTCNCFAARKQWHPSASFQGVFMEMKLIWDVTWYILMTIWCNVSAFGFQERWCHVPFWCLCTSDWRLWCSHLRDLGGQHQRSLGWLLADHRVWHRLHQCQDHSDGSDPNHRISKRIETYRNSRSLGKL